MAYIFGSFCVCIAQTIVQGTYGMDVYMCVEKHGNIAKCVCHSVIVLFVCACQVTMYEKYAVNENVFIDPDALVLTGNISLCASGICLSAFLLIYGLFLFTFLSMNFAVYG